MLKPEGLCCFIDLKERATQPTASAADGRGCYSLRGIGELLRTCGLEGLSSGRE